VTPAVKREATTLSSSFIAPAAGGRTTDLADRQTAVVGNVESSIAAQAQSLSDAADKILVFKPDELKSLNMVTAAVAPATGPATAKTLPGRLGERRDDGTIVHQPR